MNFLAQDWFILLTVSICVFFVAYFWSEKILNFFYKKTLGTRTEVLELMDKMLIETDKARISALLFLSSFGLSIAAFLLAWPNILAGAIISVLVLLLGFQIPRLAFRSLWESRCNAIVNQMVDAMTIMANGISAGLSVTQSMERVVLNMGGAISQEFNLALNKIHLGMPLEQALSDFGDRIPRQDVQMFVTSVNILKETGGNMAETFATISTVVRERQKVERKIQALTTQGKTQGVILSLAPLAILGIFSVLNPSFVEPLFNTTLGWFFLLCMFGLIGLGGIAIKKIVTIRV